MCWHRTQGAFGPASHRPKRRERVALCLICRNFISFPCFTCTGLLGSFVLLLLDLLRMLSKLMFDEEEWTGYRAETGDETLLG